MRIKCFLIVGALGLAILVSCSKEEILDVGNQVNDELPVSRALAEGDSTNAIMPLVVDSSLIEKERERSLQAFSITNVSDPYMASNMRAIATAGISIQSRNGQFLTFEYAGEEVTWTYASLEDMEDPHFYLKMFAPSTGIPYMIYAAGMNKPLSVGQYKNNPEHKVLFISLDENSSTMSNVWDLVPSSSYPGYFAIESDSYLGQSDPNDFWSVFHYVIETKEDNKIGYAQYNQSASQEFMIKPINPFKLDRIEFKTEGSAVTRQEPLKIVRRKENPYEERLPLNIQVAQVVYESSNFVENSFLKYKREDNDSKKKFYRPTVSAMKVVTPLPVSPDKDDSGIRENPDMIYNISNEKIQTTLKFDIPVIAEPNSLVETTSYLENYTVSIPYIAYFRFYNDGLNKEMEIRVAGTWYGKIYSTKRDSRYPKDIVKYYDLDTGEELIGLSR